MTLERNHIIITSLICILLLCTGTVSAATYSGGDGTIVNPYQLSSDSDIDNLSTASDDWDKCFQLTNDITLEGDHTPIASGSNFIGDFDGNGYVIKNLTINEESINVGFFSITDMGANIHDLGIETSSDGVYSTSSNVGILIGKNFGGNVSNCSATGDTTGSSEVGGLIGMIDGGTISNCYATITVNATSLNSYAGGLVGTNLGGTVNNCYATGNITGYNRVGGLIGDSSGTVNNSFAAVNNTADGSSVAGFIGNNAGTINEYCYYSGSLEIGDGTYTSEDNFTNFNFVSGTSGLNWNSGGNLITTEDDPSYIWKIIDGSTFPFFQWQVTEAESSYSGGSGTIDDPYQLSTSTAIEELSSNPDDWGLNFTLTGDITLTGNHTPIGNSSIKFTGDFDGNGHTIKNLTINQESNYAGFFGYTLGANVHDLGIETSSYGIKSTGQRVGGLVGWLEYGTVSNCSFAGTVSGSSDLVGGLVGMNKYGTAISNSSATGNVTGSGSYVGGLVGENWGSTIIDCSATGTVSGSIDCVGGLVGFNRYDLNINTNVSNSYATGDVTGRNRVGGLVGFNDNSTVSTSYATGTVNGSGSSVGGLVGYNDDSATVINSFATGNVSGTGDRVGGLVGYNYDSATVTNSFATGTVSGSSDLVGGLVGYNYDSATVTNSFATGTVSGSNRVGGLVGFNSVGTVNDYCYYSSTGSNYNEIGKSTSYVNFTNLSFVSGSSGLNWDGDITTADDSGFVWKIIEEYTLPYFQWQDTPDPVPYVESLSPSIGFNNTDSSESFWINISGCSFYNTTDSVVVNLTMDGQTPISGEIDEASHTYTTINAIFNLTEAIAGNWSLYVYNLGGQTSTANIFTVKSIVTPDAPEGFTNNTGNFWVNHSWDADTSSTTDSYNISYDGGWDNGTTNNYFNQTSGLSAHAWSNITVYAYNATDSTLSEGVSDKVQIPNNDVTILDVTDITATEGETINFDVNSTDADNDAPTFACNQSDLFDSFDTSSGEVSWITDMSDAGTYSVEFNVSDGHGSVDSHTITITVNDFSLSTPVLSNETGNFYVNWSWNSILNADSYNVSLNNVWTNGTISTEINETDMDPHNISSIQVLAFNETYGVLSDSVSDSVTLSNNPVSISNLNDISISEYELININALSADPDGDSVTFGCNRTDLFSDFDTSTGNGSWQTGPTDAGTYSVEFNVSDGYGSIDTEIITITVTDFSLSTPVLSNETGNFYVNWSWNSISNADSYNVSLNNVWTNGTISTEINETDMDPHNISSIQVLAFNETYGVLSDSVSDSVTLSNNPVSISNLDDIGVNESELIEINAVFEDLDDDSVTFGCNRTDLFSDFDTSTGNGSWETDYTSSGTYSVNFNVSDGYGSTDSQVVTVTVTNVPTTMHVGSGSGYDYPGIQAAINAASEGDTISVTDGTYNENVVVNKSVTLRSENGSANTVINSTSGNTVLTLEADNITIMGFNITGASGGHGIRLSSSSNNSTLENNIVTNNGDGIVLYPSHNNTLKNNIIIENNGDGIYIEHSFNTILTENNVSVNDGNGINIAYSSNYSVLTNNIVNGNSDGIKLDTSNNTILTSNIVNGNDEFGIYFDTSENNTIVGNVANDNLLAGIYLDSSGNNTLQNNVAKGSTYFGFYLDSSSSNVLENNTAMNNTVYDFAVSGTNEINNLKITEKGAQVSFLSDSTETGIRGSATNSTALLGKTNVNGYLTIKRGGIFVKSTSVVVDKESSAPDIIISYDDSGMSSPVESSIDLYRYSESKWNAVSDTSLDTSSNKVTAALSEGTFGLFKNSGSSSDSSSSSDDGSVVARLQSKGTTAILYTNSDGELNGDTVVKSKNAITTLTLYKGTVGTDAAGNTVNKVTVTKPESMPANTPAEVLESGLYYDFGPSGTTFNKEVLITIDFDPEEYQDRNPTIYTHSEENGWIALETTIDWENGRATAYTTHFSLYALFGDDAGEVVEETSQVSAESPKHVENGEIPAEDKGGFGFVYLILGIVIVAGIGYVIMKKQKDGGGL
ncbi:GLUG motif-containing protein [uncultured Methanolobus sp.]|uniref:GLUG motif-containing protein n=1 Tax=uncultured Methanolobus sp. TaxID=218300 RepID=UPI002AAADD33|nr:GLUG motif-containing protein [uncultured Methanolobus sp.]